MVFLNQFSNFAAAMQKRARHIFAALHLLVIIFWLGGTTLFVHSHDIDGKGIVHSHPYAGDADDHSHTPGDCQQIQRLANLDFVVCDSYVNDIHLYTKHIDEAIAIVEHTYSADILFTSLRAPPVVA